MGACRETMSIWFRVGKIWNPYYPGYSKIKALKDLFKFVFIRRPYLNKYDRRYFWHDSFGKYLNRLILCRIFGHKPTWLQDGSCSDEQPEHYCFKCEQEVNPGIDC